MIQVISKRLTADTDRTVILQSAQFESNRLSYTLDDGWKIKDVLAGSNLYDHTDVLRETILRGKFHRPAYLVKSDSLTNVQQSTH